MCIRDSLCDYHYFFNNMGQHHEQKRDAHSLKEIQKQGLVIIEPFEDVYKRQATISEGCNTK